MTWPDELLVVLRRHLEYARNLHEKDLADGLGTVYLPHALANKYPAAPREWHWQYVFPASKRSVDPRTGVAQRHHLDESSM